MLEFGKGIYYSRLWFLDSKGCDWLAALFRKPGEPWQFVYRFRYDADGNEPERRNWFTVTIDRRTAEDCLQELMPMIQLLGDGMGKALDGNLHTLVLETAETEKLFAAMKGEAWCHFTFEPIAESEGA